MLYYYFMKASRWLYLFIHIEDYFIDLLKQEQYENEAAMAMLEVGNSPLKPKLKWRRVNHRIEVLKTRLRNDEVGLMGYIDTVSHCVHL